MKYYAVTEDPKELMHFGIKGMKWGIIRTDAQLGHPKTTSGRRSTAKTKATKARSDAYQRAKEKLSAGMRNGIQKAKDSIREYNSPAAKAERSFQKHLQLARQGRLKYKGVSDDEVYRIADRLALERTSRQLSGTEPQSYLRRLKSAVQEGTIEGVGRGTSAYIDARMRGRGQTTAKIKEEKRMARFHNSLAGRRAANREERAEDRKMRREVKREADKAYYVERAEEGLPIDTRFGTVVRNSASALAKGTGKVILDVASSGGTIKTAKDIGRLYKGEFASKDWTGATRSGRAKYLASAKKKSAEEERLRKLREARDMEIAKHRGKTYAYNKYGPLPSAKPAGASSKSPSPSSGSAPGSSSGSTHSVRRGRRPVHGSGRRRGRI